MSSNHILTIDHIVRTYGGLTAVDVSGIGVRQGSITALIGPNGAGKSTLFNVISGFESPDSGSWAFHGEDLAGVSPHRIARKGMIRTFQLTRSLDALTVHENMLFAAARHPGERLLGAIRPWRWRAAEQAAIEKAEQLLERFDLAAKRDDYAGGLSGGQRKLLEIARALMNDPTMIMLDEPMAGVNPALSMRIQDQILNLREAGLTVLFVEHDMRMVRRISDEVIVMAAGRVIATGSPAHVMDDPQVVSAYLGDHHQVSLRELL